MTRFAFPVIDIKTRDVFFHLRDGTRDQVWRVRLVCVFAERHHFVRERYVFAEIEKACSLLLLMVIVAHNSLGYIVKQIMC